MGSLNTPVSEGFIGMVSADTEKQLFLPDDKFWKEIGLLGNNELQVFVEGLVRFFSTSSGPDGYLEASYSDLTFGVDLVRNNFRVKNIGEVSLSPRRDTPVMKSKKMEDRILRNRYELYGGPQPSSILLNVASTGEVLFVLDGTHGEITSMLITGKNIKFFDGDSVVYQTPMTSITALKALLQHSHAKIIVLNDDKPIETDAIEIEFR